MGINVKKAVASDSIDIRNLYIEGSGRELTIERLRTHIIERPSAVARYEGKLIGFAFCLTFAPDITELGNIFVASDWRGRGVGSRLIKEIENQAVKVFDSVIIVNSMLYEGVPDKRPATNFYLQLGYIEVWNTGPTRVFIKQLKQSLHDKNE